MDPFIKTLLGLDIKLTDDEVRAIWEKRTASVCKPCWELKYCPYGPLVEEFPGPGSTRKDATEHHLYLQHCLESGLLGSGEPLDPKRRALFEEDVASFDPDDYQEELDEVETERSCQVFGHTCPVFLVNEPLTETRKLRQIDRKMKPGTKKRIARRDNNTCQQCKTKLRDNEIEFDHVIPVSKGGSSEEHNLRVACSTCNRDKGADFEP